MEVIINELYIMIKAETGELHLDQETDRVRVEGSIDYGTFMKMIKLLKRTRSRESFTVDYAE